MTTSRPPSVVESIFDVIAQINAGGATILLVEQNAQMALQLAHRGYVLETFAGDRIRNLRRTAGQPQGQGSIPRRGLTD